MVDGMFSLVHACLACGSTRAGVPSKCHGGSVVQCLDCGQAIGSLDAVRREVAERYREKGRALASQIYRTSRGIRRP